MDRRGFLRGILAAAAAPAIVRAESLMRIYVPPEPAIVAPAWEAWAGDSYVAFVHPDMYAELMALGARTGEAALYRGELYSYGVKIIPSELAAAPVLAAAPSAFELTRENIDNAIRQLIKINSRAVERHYLR